MLDCAPIPNKEDPIIGIDENIAIWTILFPKKPILVASQAETNREVMIFCLFYLLFTNKITHKRTHTQTYQKLAWRLLMMTTYAKKYF